MRLLSPTGTVHVVNGPFSRFIDTTQTACGKRPTWRTTRRAVTCTVCRFWLNHYEESA